MVELKNKKSVKLKKDCCNKKENGSCCNSAKKELTNNESCCCGKTEKLNEDKVKQTCCKHEEKSCCKHEEKSYCKHEEKICCEHEEKSCCEHEEKSCCSNNKHSCCESGASSSHSCCLKEVSSVKGLSCCSSTSKTSSCCSKNGTKKDINKKLIFLSISLVMLILSVINFWKLVGLEQISYLDFGYVAVVLCGYPIFYNAYNALKNKKLTSACLVSVAITASIILEIICRTSNLVGEMHNHSYVFVAGEVAFLMTLGGLIESWTIKSSRKGIERIVNMSPKVANVKVGNEIKTVKIADVKVGDIVVCKPNELISVDGVVVSGNSAVDESSVTGEFLPVDVKPGSVVYGATWNKMGVIEIEVTKKPEDMTVNKLIHLALEAEEQKAPISRVVDKFTGWLIPCIILVAILIGIISYFAFNLTWMQALIRVVTILVVFCPCSLTLATPTAIAAGIGSGAYHGIIIKSGEALERLANCNTLAFDKTGTITVGDVQVKEVVSFNNDEKELLMLTASAEKYSEHPIGKAVLSYAENIVTIKEPKNTCSKVGVGISATIGKDDVEVVSLKQAENMFKNNSNLKDLSKFYNVGYTIIVTIKNKKPIGALCLYDTIRNDAFETMNKLKENGIETLMLTGDNIKSAKNIAKACGIATVKASLMPEDKLTEIKNLQNENKVVCMVGDGVNDAPALASADCSVAMSAIGNDVAVETADIAVMNSDIKNIYNAYNLSKKTLKTIKRNIAISMTINLISVLLSFFGILNPATGAIVHTCSSIFVVLSSALILKTKYFK